MLAFLLYVTCVYICYEGFFIELPPFERRRADYLGDDGYRALQHVLMKHPEAGDLMPDTGRLRKLRFADARRSKGKRGGQRVIYYWWVAGLQFWLFTLNDKDEMTNLTPQQRKVFRAMIKAELEARRTG